MNLKQCKYSKCRRVLYLYKTSVKGCCCEEHVRLAKQEYNINYYKLTKLNNKIVKHANIFKTCIDHFGEDTEFDANFLELLVMDWELETHKVVIDNLEYIAVGDYAYIISKTKKIKIIRL